MVPQPVAKITIFGCPVTSGDCLVALIAKLAKMGGIHLVGNGRLVKRLLDTFYYTIDHKFT